MILEQEVDKIRAVRQRLSAQCGHDPKRLLEYYKKVSQELRATGQFRFANQPGAPRQEQPAAK